MPNPHGGDWNSSLTLGALVPGLSTTLKDSQQLIAEAKAAEQAAQQKLINQFNNKVAELNSVIANAQRLFNDITNNLDSTGVSVLNIVPNTGGYQGLITDLSLATNKPLQNNSGFYAGTLLLVTAPDITQTAAFYTKLQKLFTLS